MGFQFNGTQANVTLNAGTIVNTIGTPTVVSGIQSGVGTTTLGTVGANKKWYIIGYMVSHNYSVGAGRGEIELNGIPIFTHYCNGTYDDIAVTANFNLEACPVLTATQTLTLVVTTNGGLEASVVYVEVSV